MQTWTSWPAPRAVTPLAVLAAALLLSAGLATLPARADDQDAHALAQKFAEEAKPGAPAADEATEQRRRDAVAKQEAAQRAAVEAKRKAAEAKRRADAARRAAQQARIDEQDMLARARAEAAERAAEERAFQAEVERREAERAAVEAEVETWRLDAEMSPAEKAAAEERVIEAARAADAARRAMEEAREDEARRLAEKLRLAQERRAAQEAAKAALQAARSAVLQPLPKPGDQAASTSAPVEPPSLQSPLVPPSLPKAPEVAAAAPSAVPAPPVAAPLPPASADAPVQPQVEDLARSSTPSSVTSPAPGASAPAPQSVALSRPPPSRPSAAAMPETRVTVLILMQPGDRGIRRTNKTADPVLCLGPDCYVSKGSDADARHVTRWQALGTFNTLGGRAGACNHSLGCVFRNVDLGAVKAMLQPIDLKIMHHDRRETREVRADPTCEMIGPRLTCAAGIKASDYRMWVVPESVARRAGPAALDAAVKAGLIESGRV